MPAPKSVANYFSKSNTWLANMGNKKGVQRHFEEPLRRAWPEQEEKT